MLAVWFTMTSAVLVPLQDKAVSAKTDVASVKPSDTDGMGLESWSLSKDYKALDRIMTDDWEGR
jgi:hypothetical protein